jgi:hypothetical protein
MLCEVNIPREVIFIFTNEDLRDQMIKAIHQKVLSRNQFLLED